MGSLYIVSTPIGNLQDITIRAIQVLFEVEVILAEQKDKTFLLLSKLKERYPEITKGDIPKIISFNEYEEEIKIPKAIQTLLEGSNTALVSEAGTPLLSDPGYKIVREAIKRDIPIIPIPGASALLPALTASGMSADKVLFVGFTPKNTNKRKSFYKDIHDLFTHSPFNMTVVFYESPHRLLESIEQLYSIFPEYDLVVAKELTKIHETFIRGNVKEVLDNMRDTTPKGEYVLLLRKAH